MSPVKIKSLLVLLAKITVSMSLLGYLVYNDRLDFTELWHVFSQPTMAIAVVLFWVLGPSFLGALRWRLLLEGAGFSISITRAISLQVTGFFFNTSMPGAVGGDLIKVYYIIKENPKFSKSAAIMSIFLDRVIGLSALFFIGLVAAFFQIKVFWANPILLSFFTSIVVFCLGIVVFFSAALYQYKGLDPFEKILDRPLPGFSKLLGIYQALRKYRSARHVIVKSFLISMLIQAGALLLFYSMTITLIQDQDPSLAKIAAIFPLGILSTALPLAPGGLGVGHLVFERLFTLIGLNKGADVANAYMLSLLFMNLLGIISYLRHKKQGVSLTKPIPEHFNTPSPS